MNKIILREYRTQYVYIEKKISIIRIYNFWEIQKI